MTIVGCCSSTRCCSVTSTASSTRRRRRSSRICAKLCAFLLWRPRVSSRPPKSAPEASCTSSSSPPKAIPSGRRLLAQALDFLQQGDRAERLRVVRVRARLRGSGAGLSVVEGADDHYRHPFRLRIAAKPPANLEAVVLPGKHQI